jgi:hypothetical protein
MIGIAAELVQRSERTRALPIAHRSDRRPFPMKVRPHVGASLAAGLTYEPRLQIGKPDVIRPLIRADRDRMAATIVRTIDQETAHAGGAHLSEGDLLRADDGGHAPMIPPIAPVCEAARNGGLPSVMHPSWISGMRALGLRVRTKRFARNIARQVPQKRRD